MVIEPMSTVQSAGTAALNSSEEKTMSGMSALKFPTSHSKAVVAILHEQGTGSCQGRDLRGTNRLNANTKAP